MTTEAQKEAFKRYNAKRKNDLTMIHVPKLLRNRIKQNALELKLSMIEYLTQLTNSK